MLLGNWMRFSFKYFLFLSMLSAVFYIKNKSLSLTSLAKKLKQKVENLKIMYTLHF